MDRARIDSEHLVARYLADQLPEPERAAFEAHLHTHPELVEELEAAARFKFALRKLDEAGDLDRKARRKALLSRPVLLAAAASLVLLTFAALVWISRSSAEPLIIASSLAELAPSGAAVPKLARSIAVIHTRTDIDASVELPAEGEAIELVVELNRSAPSYRASLRRSEPPAAPVEIGSARNLQPSAEGHISVFLRAASLSPRRYELAVLPESDQAGAPEVFTLDLTQ